MAEPVVVTCCAAPDKDMARKTQVMESKKCRRHSKIEERGTHSIDRMVERKKHRKETRSWKGSTWTRTNKDFFFTSLGRIHREVRHGYTNSDGLKNRRSTMVERSTKKTQFEVERSTSEAFLLLEMGSADRGVQRIQRRDVSRCNEKRGMAGRSTGQKTMEEKKAKHFSRIRKKHAEAQSTNHKKERFCS